MKRIDKGNGVYGIELEEGDTCIDLGLFSRNRELVELYIPDGVTEIEDNSFMFCYSLAKVHLPASIEKLGNAIFYSVTIPIEIYYDGTSEKFLELAKPYKKKVMVQVPGEYDVQPYCNSEGTYYKEQEEWQCFDSFCADCRVICNDGKCLYFGYRNHDKKNY